MPAAPRPNWPPLSAPLALAAAFVASLLGGLFVAVAGAGAGASLDHPPPEVDIIATLVQDGALIASALVFASRRARPAPEQFGLRSTRALPAFGWMAAAGLAFLGFSVIWVALLGLHDREKVVDQLGANQSAVALVAVLALTCVIAPLAEEFFFRGFFFRALSNWHGPWPAALITGVVFGAIHAGSAPAGYLVPLGFFGAALCLVLWRTGSLYPCVLLHTINNSVAFGVTEHWGWQIPVALGACLAAVTLALAAGRATLARLNG